MTITSPSRSSRPHLHWTRYSSPPISMRRSARPCSPMGLYVTIPARSAASAISSSAMLPFTFGFSTNACSHSTRTDRARLGSRAMPIRTALLALCVCVLVAVPSASAAPPGKWTQLGEANLANIDQVALARTPDGVLHAVWTIPAPNNDTIVHDAIAPNGTAAPPNVIQTGWADISNTPDLLATPDGLRVFFGGIRSTNADEVNSNENTATAPASGATWDLFPGTTVTGDAAYGSDAGAALLGDNTPI